MDPTLSHRFEVLVSRIFEAQGYRVEHEVRVGNFVVDMIIEKLGTERTYVELKLYRSSNISTTTLLNALMQLDLYRKQEQNVGAILVFSATLTPQLSVLAEQHFSEVKIIDSSRLRALASVDIELLQDLDRILQNASMPSVTRLTDDSQSTLDILLSESRTSGSQRSRFRDTPSKKVTGAEIAKRIRKIRPGNEDARLFEITMLEALRYIFDEDLVSWSEQKVTDDGLSRYDVVARVSSVNDFWNLVVQSFRSKYVVFEFKNHAERIKQGQIYTTEKYLYVNAMRSMAVIISRSGADNNAAIAARGALRESGKLIINITERQVANMLVSKDKGDDPNELLFEIVDDMLLRLTR